MAALLITRQVVGNVKESLIPYIKQHFKLAKINFDMYGAVTPTTPAAATTLADHKKDDDANCPAPTEEEEATCAAKTGNSLVPPKERNVSQATVEGSQPPVC